MTAVDAHDEVAAAPSLWAQLLRRRLREPSFWVIQAGVLAITALHLAFEALNLFGTGLGVRTGLHHLPVVLYVAPIVYAGLRYGFEGSVLTGAWCIVLTLPNEFIWHSRGLLWLGELLYASFVVGIGIVVAIPVERERRQRQRLAATSRRLALLNEIASSLVSSAGLDRALPAVLVRLRDVLGLDAAGMVSWEAADGAPAETWIGSLPESAERLAADLRSGSLRGGGLAEGCLVVLFGGEGAGTGALVVVPAAARPLDGADEDLVKAVASEIGVALDNARLHRQERDRLRSYVHEVTRAQEEERKRLARELHDTAAQDLVLLGRGLDALVDDPGSLAHLLEDLRARAGETLESLRRLSRDLRPTVLDDLGLVPALEWLAADLTERSGIRTRFGLSGPARRLAAEAELALFRITQEALRNAERHAESGNVEVRVSFTDDGVCVEIADDGHGFVVPGSRDRFVRSGGLGLLGIRERAELIGGTLDVRSAPETGTTVTVTVGDLRPEGA